MPPAFELGEWLPDLSSVELPGLVDVENVIPTLDGYSAVPGPEALDISGGPATRVRGAKSGRTQSGIGYLVAGTDSELFYTTDLAGYTTDPGAFAVPSNGRWVFGQYRNSILATNGVDPPQHKDLGLGTDFASVSDHASLGRCAAVDAVRGFYILGDITGRGNNAGAIGRLEGGVHWSSVDDPLGWPTMGTQAARDNLSDFQPLEGPGGRVMAIVPTAEYIAVLRERQVWRMDRVGDSQVFAFRMIDANLGCIVRDGAIAVRNRIYFPSESGFMVFNGAEVAPIGHQKVDRTWIQTVNGAGIPQISTAHIPQLRIVLWSTPISAETRFDEAWGYQYELGRWTKLALSGEWLLGLIQEVVGEGDMDSPPLDTQDMDDPGDLGDVNLDTLGVPPVPTESLAYFDLMHALKVVDDAAPLTGRIVTGDLRDPEDRRMKLRAVRPHHASGIDTAYIGMRVHARNNSNGVFDLSGEPQRFPTGLETNLIPYRRHGRYMRAEFELRGGVQHFTGFEARWQPGGRR